MLHHYSPIHAPVVYHFNAAFHYSSQLLTWLQTWFSTRFTARFSTSSCGFLQHAFDQLLIFVVENLVANRSRFADS